MRIVRSITIKEPLRADPSCRYVKKEFAYAFSCAYTELWMHLEVWRPPKKLALQSAIASSNSYASFVLSKLPRAYARYKHEQILNLSSLTQCGVQN